MTKEDAKLAIANLVKKFSLLDSHKIKGFNEAATKQGFIQPLFEALGWDFTDTDEVSPEEHASNGRVDYAFKLNNVSQFYIEAKSLKADLNREDFVKQAVSYSYARGVTWAVLTDFESLRVFNALKNTPFISLSFTEYVEKFDDLWLLSKQATAGNELSKKAQAYGAMPLFIPIEKRLFKQLSLWRESLFNEIYRYNEEKKLEREQVDSMIQKLFNRLIFMRTAEDRRIEENGLRALLNRWKTADSKGYLIKPLRALFNEYDGYYDSELFNHHLLDEDIFIDNESLQPVLEGLYEIPGSLASYNFNDIDADVLGAVYEQYLGHVAEVTKQRAKEAQSKMDLGTYTQSYTLTAKKERRKEHGIYYTPKFITDYIVRETVGRFLQENAGYPDKLHNIKILDPACGSGSFLIRAYDELLRYHAKEINKPLDKLDQWERLPILTNNIFGVDLDKQAVEVARLNLLLRSLAKREPLPYLGNNIKNGNSLISGTEEELKKYFGDSWKDKNPFNWEDEFKDIIKNGGFDVVIGNPPYVRVDALPEEDKAFWKDNYSSSVGKYDLYYLFLEQAIKLTKKVSVFSFITPNRYCTNTTGDNLRKLLLQQCDVINIISVSRLGVFEEAANYPVIVIGRKGCGNAKRLTYYDVRDVNQLLDLQPTYELTEEEINKLPRHIIPINVSANNLKLALKLLGENLKAGNFVVVQEGLRIPQSHETEIPNSESLPIIKQFQFSRYSKIKPASFITEQQGPLYIQSNSDRTKNCFKDKIIFAEDALQIEATWDTSKGLCQGGVYFATLTNKKYSLRYLLALYNSKLLTFIFKSLYSGIHMGGGYLRFRTQYLEELPIHAIDFNNDAQKNDHDDLVLLVDKILDINKELNKLSEYEIDKKEQLEKEIKTTDEKIDNLVYDLYGLTEEERKIVEGQIGNDK